MSRASTTRYPRLIFFALAALTLAASLATIAPHGHDGSPAPSSACKLCHAAQLPALAPAAATVEPPVVSAYRPASQQIPAAADPLPLLTHDRAPPA